MKSTDVNQRKEHKRDWKEDYKRKTVPADEAAKAGGAVEGANGRYALAVWPAPRAVGMAALSRSGVRARSRPSPRMPDRSLCSSLSSTSQRRARAVS